MEMREFANIVKNNLQEHLGTNVTIRKNAIMKNNNLVLTGLALIPQNSNIGPTIYLNGYLDKYENGCATISDIVTDIINIYNNSTPHHFDVENFYDFSKIKSKIIFKLISYGRNKELLEGVPYIPYLDFAIVFQVLIDDLSDNNSTASILIRNEHTLMWKSTIRDLYDAALENTPKLQPCCITSMNDIILEMMKTEHNIPDKEVVNILDNIYSAEQPQMYVLSNKNKINGAACLLYPRVLDDFAEKINSDFYVLPSSLHECICVPASFDMDAEQLLEMVREVNETQVEQEDLLTDSVYFYSKQKSILEKVA